MCSRSSSSLGRLPAHDLDRVLVAQVVRALDRVERVRLPRVLGVERRVDAALGRVRMRADGVDLGDDPDRCARPPPRSRAARWPARPAPITRTSCSGMRRWRFYASRAAAARLAAGAPGGPGPIVTIPRSTPSRVDRHQGAQADQRLVRQQRLERVVRAHAQAVAAVVARPSPTRSDDRRGSRRARCSTRLAVDTTPTKLAAGVHHREPGPAVAQEVLALGAGRAAARSGIATGSASITSATRRSVDAFENAVWARPSGRPGRGRCR